jgi:hypothetical protein
LNQQNGSRNLRKDAPPPDYNMEDGTVTRNTIQDIQKFFGLTAGVLTTSSPDIPRILERKYSHTLVSSRSEEFSQTNPQVEEVPKNANDAVSTRQHHFLTSDFHPWHRSRFGSLVKIICFLNLSKIPSVINLTLRILQVNIFSEGQRRVRLK